MGGTGRMRLDPEEGDIPETKLVESKDTNALRTEQLSAWAIC